MKAPARERVRLGEPLVGAPRAGPPTPATAGTWFWRLAVPCQMCRGNTSTNVLPQVSPCRPGRLGDITEGHPMYAKTCLHTKASPKLKPTACMRSRSWESTGLHRIACLLCTATHCRGDAPRAAGRGALLLPLLRACGRRWRRSGAYLALQRCHHCPQLLPRPVCRLACTGPPGHVKTLAAAACSPAVHVAPSPWQLAPPLVSLYLREAAPGI